MALIVFTMNKRRKCKGEEKMLFGGEGKIRRVKLNPKIERWRPLPVKQIILNYFLRGYVTLTLACLLLE